ncbi:MAG: radical SAM protein [Candidatus Omnitrophota bacterium]
MVTRNNKFLPAETERKLKDGLPIRLGLNKINELTRLIYEIRIAQKKSFEEVMNETGFSPKEENKGEIFNDLKKKLLSMRYPSINAGKNPCEKIRIMPLKTGHKDEECAEWRGALEPKRIFVEKKFLECDWTQELISRFPQAEVLKIDNIGEVRKAISAGDPTKEYNSRRENIIVTGNKASFIKPCPCTKDAKRCGYWILNLGFGCPFDCSYCYLQTYSNIPGIILNANIEDYYEAIKYFDGSVTGSKIRIGTGEFTDSLALEKYTGYAPKLIEFFRATKNLILELKTKTSDIESVLKEKPHENVVLAWSINTPGIAEKYEKGASFVKERIEAAFNAAKAGYQVAFHFDPLVWYEGWEKEYEGIIEELFSYKEIRANTLWISLGTLRYTPGLKQAAEERFNDNEIFYGGEFFLGFDGKFRYPEMLRTSIYKKISGFIRDRGVSCWIYLCMEPKEMSAELSGLGYVAI